MSHLITENKERIAANRAAIFDLEGDVNFNKARAYLTRSMAAENNALILKNYNSAFLGNRQLANENTEAIFRNRINLLQCLPTTSDVEVNYREAMINKQKLLFLKHRSRLNASVIGISEDMAAVNAQLIAINRRVMEANELIKNFNAGLIAEFDGLYDAKPTPTPESNAALIAANAAEIQAIGDNVRNNNGSIDELTAAIETNRAAILANAVQISERRDAILKNHDAVAANRKRVIARMSARR